MLTKKHITPPRVITNAGTRETYRQQWIPVRVGSQDHEKIPSLHCGMRHYRDGRKEEVNGNAA